MSNARCILWCSPAQAELFKQTLDESSIELVAAGCPEAAHIGKMASDLGCDPVDDLRYELTNREIDTIIFGDPGAFSDEPNDSDLEIIKAAHAKNITLLTLEPMPGTVNGLGGTGFAESMSSGALNELTHMLPLTRHTPLIDELYSALETFGPVRTCSLTLGVPQLLGSVGARLFDSMDLIRSLIGIPNIIESSYISPLAGRGLHPLPGQSLRDLHGEFTINLRFSDGRCASILLSDQVGSSICNLTLLGNEGHINVTHSGFEWFNREGEMIDSHCVKTESKDAIDPMRRALKEQLIERCTGVGPSRAPIDYSSVLSMTHSTLLSTRTGQGESPHAIEHLMLSM